MVLFIFGICNVIYAESLGYSFIWYYIFIYKDKFGKIWVFLLGEVLMIYFSLCIEL